MTETGSEGRLVMRACGRSILRSFLVNSEVNSGQSDVNSVLNSVKHVLNSVLNSVKHVLNSVKHGPLQATPGH